MQLSPRAAHRVYRYLLQHYAASEREDLEIRWAWLVAAHIVGQHHFVLHSHNHAIMLGLALRSGDAKEAVGQLFRLALTPVGHLIGRLPPGNIGRATVSAFQPMPIDKRSRRLIDHALRATCG